MLLIAYPSIFFGKKPTGRPEANAITIERFCNLKKVNDGMNFGFLVHMGKRPCSSHNTIVKCFDALINQSQHIDKVIDKQTSKQKLNNRLGLKTSINCIRYLTYQGCVLRRYDELQAVQAIEITRFLAIDELKTRK
jgi:hypothetical protein